MEKSTPALIAAVDDHVATADDAATAAGRTLGPRRRLALAGQAYIRFALRDPGVFSVTFRPERVDVTDQEYQIQGAAAFQQLVDLVEAVQAAGWQPDRRSDEVAGVMWAQVHGLAVLALHGALGAVVSGHGGAGDDRVRDDGARGDGARDDGARGGAGDNVGADVRQGPDEEVPLRLAALFNEFSFGDDPEPPPPSDRPPIPTPDARFESRPHEETTT